MPLRKEGPLTREELIELWKSVTDRGYWEPILADPQSRAIIEAMAEMYARASVSVDRNTQGMFIRPWSGQTDEPSGGERKATVVMEVRRTRLFHMPMPLLAGVTTFQHWINDWGKEGPQLVTTNRRYLGLTSATLAPGDAGPLVVEAEAERAGFGYNVPAPGTIQRIAQQGGGLANTGASLIPGESSHELRATEQPDVPSVAHVGAMVEITSGANVGQIRAAIGFANPVPGVSGGSLLLAPDGVFTVSGATGTYLPGEPVLQTPSGASGRVLAHTGDVLVVRRVTGAFVAGQLLTGDESAVTATLDAITQSPDMVAEVALTGWRVLDWAEAFGLEVTNPSHPAGGRSGMLDELGNERAVFRANPLEDDGVYRERVATPADVVSPNAIRRTANRILKPFCLEVCLREVGGPLFPGAFYDEDFYDYGRVTFTLAGGGVGFVNGEVVQQVTVDGVTTGVISIDSTGIRGFDHVVGPGFVNGGTITGLTGGTTDTITSVPVGDPLEFRFAVQLSEEESRAFFMLGVPPFTSLGDATYYDALIDDNFFDVLLDGNFYDGLPPEAIAIYDQIYQAVAAVKAAGVRFELYIEAHGCF